MSSLNKTRFREPAHKYERFKKINGRHPFKQAASGAYVDYSARDRPGGEVFFFNFDLAKEMGLIARDHPEGLNAKLKKAILETFSLEIINEYDIFHDRKFPAQTIRPEKFMATRYLQLQHPSLRGKTSGDGRSIWNGCIRSSNGFWWDVTSNGTGATRLSPATAIKKKFFRTGDPTISYGCGRADAMDGISAALMSEIFHFNDIATERVLAIITFKNGSAINVRAGKNLFRPAHFFRPLKQGNYDELRAITDYYLDRETKNRAFPRGSSKKNKYKCFLDFTAINFAKTAAMFESEYIFCWLDWDGDNILVDGGIIDYGSVRQFGLFHHEYRYDDTDKMSTSIKEQRAKARYIVQTFAQITDFLIRGKRRPVDQFVRHPALHLFDRQFEQSKDQILLYNMGLDKRTIQKFYETKAHIRLIRRFRKIFSYFERVKSRKGKRGIEDGITWDAIFCMRDILRELPHLILANKTPLTPERFISIIRSSYATAKDLKLNSYRRSMVRQFQALYLEIFQLSARITGQSLKALMSEAGQRTSVINRYERVTGDSILYVATKLIRSKNRIYSKEMHRMFREFVNQQILRPEYVGKSAQGIEDLRSHEGRKTLGAMLRLVKIHREGI